MPRKNSTDAGSEKRREKDERKVRAPGAPGGSGPAAPGASQKKGPGVPAPGRVPPPGPAAPAQKPPSFQSAPGTPDAFEPTQEEIARRAYEIFLARGGVPGDPMQDWLEAEAQLKSERNRKP